MYQLHTRLSVVLWPWHQFADLIELGIDSAFLKKNNRVLDLKVKCATCGSEIQVFTNDRVSAGEV